MWGSELDEMGDGVFKHVGYNALHDNQVLGMWTALPREARRVEYAARLKVATIIPCQLQGWMG